MDINTLKTDYSSVQGYAPVKKQSISQGATQANTADSEATAEASDTVDLSLKSVNFSKTENGVNGVNAPVIGNPQQARQVVDNIIQQLRGNPQQALAAFSNV